MNEELLIGGIVWLAGALGTITYLRATSGNGKIPLLIWLLCLPFWPVFVLATIEL